MANPIVGTFTNAKLGITIRITNEDSNSGGISGTATIGGLPFTINGIWNTSTMSPNAVFMFTGTSNTPTATIVSGSGAAVNFQNFNNTHIGLAVAEAGGVVTTFNGTFSFSV